MTPKTFYSKMPEHVATHVQKYVRFLASIGCEAYGLGSTSERTTTSKTPDAEIIVDTRTFNKKAATGFLPGKSIGEIVRELNERVLESGADILKHSPEGIQALTRIQTVIYERRNSDDPEQNSFFAQQATRAYFEMAELPVKAAVETYEDTNDFERSPIPLLIGGVEAFYLPLPPRKKVSRTRIKKDTLEARIRTTIHHIGFTNQEPFTARPETERARLTV